MTHTPFHGHSCSHCVCSPPLFFLPCVLHALAPRTPSRLCVNKESSKQMSNGWTGRVGNQVFSTLSFMDLSCLGIRILSGEGDSYSHSQHGTHAKSSCLYSPSTNFPRTSSPNIINDTYTRTTPHSIPVCPLQHFRLHGKTFHDALPGTTQRVYLRLVASHGGAE